MIRKRKPLIINNKEIVINGIFPRIARLKSEYFEWIEDPFETIAKLETNKTGADLFTFLHSIADRNSRYKYYFEWNSIAVLSITTYENWWKKQINDKTRNMVRKAQKSGVDIRIVDFNDDLIKGIKEIYDESPLRQGKPFRHYRQDLATIKKNHISFLNRSDFIGAFYKDELIGFIKLVHDKGISHIMQIISKIRHRDKAPTNALIAKAVEICAQKYVPYLHYGVWSKRSLGDFKKHHAFEKLDIPRYFIPLNLRGKIVLILKLHRDLWTQIPESWTEILVSIRDRWYSYKYDINKSDGAVAQSGERHT